MDEEKIEKVHKGRMASLIRADIATYIDQEKDKIIERLIIEFRDNTLTENRIWGSVGGLVALKDLASTLDSDIKRGMKASEDGG